jgi:hypothetical protein
MQKLHGNVGNLKTDNLQGAETVTVEDQKKPQLLQDNRRLQSPSSGRLFYPELHKGGEKSHITICPLVKLVTSWHSKDCRKPQQSQSAQLVLCSRPTFVMTPLHQACSVIPKPSSQC